MVLFYCLRKENTRGGVCIFRHPAITAFTSMNVETPTIMAYLFDHPLYLVALIAGVLLFCLRRIMH